MKKSGLAEPDAGHEFLRHVREFSSLHLKELLELLKETVSEWLDDKAPRLGASLAFYTLLSLALFSLSLSPWPQLSTGKKLLAASSDPRPRWAPHAKAIQGLIQGAYKPGAGMVASLLGLLTLAFGASSVVVELRDALNTIWHVAPNPRNTGLGSIFWLAKERFYSFALIFGVGLLLLVSLVLNAWSAAHGKFFRFLAANYRSTLLPFSFRFS